MGRVWNLKILGVLAFSVVAVYALVATLAADFTATSSVNSAQVGANQTINISVSNTNSTVNITRVHIALPSSFSFVSGSNSTGVNEANFVSSIGADGNVTLSWTNYTRFGIINSSSTSWFQFKIIVPERQGNFFINVTTADVNSTTFTEFSVNTTNVTLKIEPSSISNTPDFGATPGTIRLNWTNTNTANTTITLNNTLASYIVEIRPDLTQSKLSANYSQSTLNKCGPYPITVVNSSGSRGNTSSINITLSPSSQSQNITLVFNDTDCSPGRYSTQLFALQNSSNTLINASINITADIPISVNNTLNNATGIGTFGGTLPGNATSYQSFFFPTGGQWSIVNATGVKINVSTSDGDLDIFLLDQSGVLKAKSINKTRNESIVFSYLPSSTEFWEIRVFGNKTSSISWNGWIIFSTINATEATSANVRIDSIDFKDVNVSTTHTKNITLVNSGNLTANNLTQSIELSYVKRFAGNGQKNFTFLVPDSTISKRIKIAVNWTGSGNYTFNVTSPNSTIIMSSTNKSVLANQSGVEQEEYVETLHLPSRSEIWTVWVGNNSVLPSDYNVSILVGMDSSAWTTSNFTMNTLNRTNGLNSTYTVSLNFTVPNQTLDGLYEGKISYLDLSGVGIQIPVRMNVTAPMLLVNNSYSSFTLERKDNTGFTRNVTSGVLLTSNGTYAVTLAFTNSSNKLYCSSGCAAGETLDMTFDSASNIPKGESKYINVSIGFNNTNSTGLYEGWIFVMANATDGNLTSKPTQTFNLTIKMNLTRESSLTVTKVVDAHTHSTFIGNESGLLSNHNISFAFDVFYLNGAQIGTSLENSSIVSVYIQESNITGTNTRVPSSGSLNVANWKYGEGIYCTSNCPSWSTANQYFLNATLPSFIPGGLYNFVLSLGNGTAGTSFNATGNLTGSVFVNNTGLHMTAVNSTSFSFTGTSNFFVNITNYGPLNETNSRVQLSESCDGWSVGSPARVDILSRDCQANTDTNSTLNIGKSGGICVIKWTITNSNTSASSCTLNVQGSPNDNWFNPTGVNLSLSLSSSSSSSSTSSTSSTGSDSTSSTSTSGATYLEITNFDNIVRIVQGKTGSGSAVIKNVNASISQTVTFSLTGINSSWYSINDTLEVIAATKNVTFNATFNIPSDAEVKDYTGTYKGSSSQATVTKDFTLRVLPTEETKSEINTTFQDLKSNFTSIWEEFNKTKAAGYNLTAAEATLNDLRTKVENAEVFLALGTDEGYFEAAQLFEQIRQLTSELANEISAAKKKSVLPPNLLTYILIGVGIAGAGFLIYLFVPVKGAGGGIAKAVKSAKPDADMAKKAKETLSESIERLKQNLRKKKRDDRDFRYKYAPEE